MSDVGLPDLDRLLAGVLLAIVVGAFLIGSIPLRRLRAAGTGGAVAALLLDAAKGFGVAFSMRLVTAELEPEIGNEIVAVVVAAALLGDCFSPWSRFKGRTGVALSFGAIFALCWPAGLVAIGAWIVGALSTRHWSVGSTLGSVVAPFGLWYFSGSEALTAYGVLAALLIVFTHRENIARLRAGTEEPIRFFKH